VVSARSLQGYILRGAAPFVASLWRFRSFSISLHERPVDVARIGWRRACVRTNSTPWPAWLLDSRVEGKRPLRRSAYGPASGAVSLSKPQLVSDLTLISPSISTRVYCRHTPKESQTPGLSTRICGNPRIHLTVELTRAATCLSNHLCPSLHLKS
jgi:hypothetical protein